MDLDFTEEQQMLRETVRGVCEKHSSLEIVRRLEDDPVGYNPELWKQLADLGVLGLTIPESHGGSGLGALEGAIVYEEFGRTLAPSPHFVSSVLGAGALLTAGSDEQQRRWLPRIAGGEAIVTPAWLEPDRGYGPAGVQMRAVREGGEIRLSGVKRHVHFAHAAHALLVLARSGASDHEIDLLLVDPQAPGVAMTQQMTLAADTQYQVVFDDVVVPAAARIGAAGSGWRTWNAVMHHGIVMLAAQAMGGAAKALEITVQYAKDREQFDKPIGAFQAISHYLADATTLVSGGRTLAYEAAWACAAGRPVDRLAPMAKLFACQTYRDVTAMCVQVHGGYGFTVDFDIQLFFRRAKQMQLSWWDTHYLEERVAASVLDAPAALERAAVVR
jgi:alkylation response protein AidB-like acyl-CoA dehydrogenase